MVSGHREMAGRQQRDRDIATRRHRNTEAQSDKDTETDGQADRGFSQSERQYKDTEIEPRRRDCNNGTIQREREELPR